MIINILKRNYIQEEHTLVSEWTNKEFKTLLQKPKLTNEQLHNVLTSRSVGAINALCSFIHSYHIGGDISGLANMMINRLKKGSWECPKCHEKQPER